LHDIAKKLLGKRIMTINLHPIDDDEEAKELNIIFDDGMEIEVGASWNEDGEFHLYEK